MKTIKNGFFISFLVLSTAFSFFAGCSQSSNFEIKWMNYDGSQLAVTTVAKNETPVYPNETPTKPSSGGVTYSFNGWDPTIVPATSNATYTAVFVEDLPTYEITWQDYNRKVLKTSYVKKGTVPSYGSEVPTRADDDTYHYTFNAWTPAPVAATKDTKYTAVYNKSQYRFEVKWENYDGTVLDTEKYLKDVTPSYKKETPVRPAASGITYIFDGWTPEITPISSDITYVAKYKESYNGVKITFKDTDGNILKTQVLSKGEMPDYGGIPTKESTGEELYIFDKWDKDFVPATADTTYVASFIKAKSYIVKEKLTTYSLVVPSTSETSSALTAAQYFSKYFKKITGVNLSIVNNSDTPAYSRLNNYISFGDTKISTGTGNNFTSTSNDDKSNYNVVRDGLAISCNGGATGLLYSAAELLEQLFDFEYLENDETNGYVFETHSLLTAANISKKSFNPIIKYRTNYASGELRNTTMKAPKDYGIASKVSYEDPFFSAYTIDGVSIKPMHNALLYLPYDKYSSQHPEWYYINSNGKQLCCSEVLNSSTALDIIYGKMKTIANEYPNKMVTFELMDTWAGPLQHGCECSKCQNYYTKYGNDSGVYMLLLNKLGDMLKQGQQKGDIPASLPGLSGLAYYSTAYAPSKNIDEVKAHDNVYMYLAPNSHNRRFSWKERETTYFQDWSTVTNGQLSGVYYYSLDDYGAGSYMLFHNDFDVMYDNFDVYKEMNLKSILQLGTWNSTGDYNFASLRSYLYKYLVNNNVTTKKEFNEKINNYFSKYFGAASDSMYQIFTKQKDSWNALRDAPSTKSHIKGNLDYHEPMTRFSFYSSSGTQYPYTDPAGNVYGLASNYDLLAGVAEYSQRVLYSGKTTDTNYIGNFSKLVNDAIEDLEVYKNNQTEYTKYYNRVVKNSLSVIYVMIECFNDTSIMNKTEFVNFCQTNKCDHYSERGTLEQLKTHWGM